MMPMKDAKDLHADITKLLMAMVDLQDHQLAQKEQVITVELGGRDF
jgi:hypothetical protein